MTTIQTYHAYIDRYGDKEGRCNFITLCEFMIETHDENKDWKDIKQRIEKNEI